jgi:N-succinyldiaminopimelate aminotransferase
MNPDLAKLQPYPFEKLARLKAGLRPPTHLDAISLSIGEPRHPTPRLISEAVLSHLHGLSSYPSTKGSGALRQSIAQWCGQRFNLGSAALDPEHQVLPVNGTREALFAFAQATVERTQNPLVLMPNPFYQIYEGAALLAGAEPYYLNCHEANGFVPDFSALSEAQWRRCQLLFLCSPGNPTGAVLDKATLQYLLEMADRYDFVIASDECYSEIYFDDSPPPTGLLQAAADMGRHDFARCVVFHSLSKRSNAPGLRSGFVAGDAQILRQFLLYRTYHGCAMPMQHQAASIAAWRDEAHVKNNRLLYQQKFTAVLDILQPVLAVQRPQAGFYLWPQTPIDDADFARGLFASENVSVLPGSYLSREVDGENPGQRRIRMALVATLDECIDAATRIRRYIESL